MTTWYQVTSVSYEPKIKNVEVISETLNFIRLSGTKRRLAKRGNWESFFPTYKEAYVFIQAEVSKQIEDAAKHLITAKQRLETFQQTHTTPSDG